MNNTKPSPKTGQNSRHYLSIKGVGDQDKQHWYLLEEDLSLPAAIIYQSKLENNLQWMQQFAQQQGVKLAPHGKTTMTVDFFSQQINAGAWAITLASVTQVAAARLGGIKRIIMANQLVGRRNMEIIAGLLDDQPSGNPPGNSSNNPSDNPSNNPSDNPSDNPSGNPSDNLEFYCLVDSLENVNQLGTFFQQANKTLNVLIEIGVENGRCGCRSDKQVINLSRAIAQHSCLKLAGIEVYEGVIHGENAEQKINSLLTNVVSLTKQLIAMDVFDYDEIILTGAGSAWYDLVSKHFYQASLNNSIVPVIRPGCYLIHDKGIYQQAQNDLLCRLNSERLQPGDLQSCLEIWAYVQSIPEPGMAIVGMGKRDVAFSDGLPQPALHYRPGNKTPTAAHPDWLTTQVMDQHAFIKIPEDSDLKVGDMISFSTSHPCLTFDKWKSICVINDDYEVIDQVSTAF